jgi:hypothetical protein
MSHISHTDAEYSVLRSTRLATEIPSAPTSRVPRPTLVPVTRSLLPTIAKGILGSIFRELPLPGFLSNYAPFIQTLFGAGIGAGMFHVYKAYQQSWAKVQLAAININQALMLQPNYDELLVGEAEPLYERAHDFLTDHVDKYLTRTEAMAVLAEMMRVIEERDLPLREPKDDVRWKHFTMEELRDAIIQAALAESDGTESELDDDTEEEVQKFLEKRRRRKIRSQRQREERQDARAKRHEMKARETWDEKVKRREREYGIPVGLKKQTGGIGWDLTDYTESSASSDTTSNEDYYAPKPKVLRGMVSRINKRPTKGRPRMADRDTQTERPRTGRSSTDGPTINRPTSTRQRSRPRHGATAEEHTRAHNQEPTVGNRGGVVRGRLSSSANREQLASRAHDEIPRDRLGSQSRTRPATNPGLSSRFSTKFSGGSSPEIFAALQAAADFEGTEMEIDDADRLTPPHERGTRTEQSGPQHPRRSLTRRTSRPFTNNRSVPSSSINVPSAPSLPATRLPTVKRKGRPTPPAPARHPLLRRSNRNANRGSP